MGIQASEPRPGQPLTQTQRVRVTLPIRATPAPTQVPARIEAETETTLLATSFYKGAVQTVQARAAQAAAAV